MPQCEGTGILVEHANSVDPEVRTKAFLAKVTRDIERHRVQMNDVLA
jgi:hypothetical protein